MEKLNIQINKPCSEKFDTFKKTDNGGFCTSCQKNVIDFTKMNNQEIIKYFSNETGKTCGVFVESQLKNYSNISNYANYKKSNPFKLSVFGLSLLSVLSFTSSYSQEKNIKNEAVKENSLNTNEKNKTKEETTEKITVSGIISDEAGPLPGATIYSKTYNVGVQSDIDGKFNFPKELKTGDALIVSFVGYKNKEIKITASKETPSKNYNIKLDYQHAIILGEVSTNKVYKTKRSLVQRIKSFFKNE